MTRRLPPGLAAYRRTPVFTEATLPAGLRHRHQTKAGVWAAITVVEGRLRLRRLDPPAETILDAASAGIVAPEEPHEVEPLGAVRFFIEFHAAPAEGAAGEAGTGAAC
ncbi:MAG TPA: DUF1971 domain-containing protein [Stellaceae bacterium]|nr:DUF1971 domain-containing protein [Stellaceae bacterium]